MTKTEENKFSSYRAVISVLDENQSIVTTLPALSSAVTNFKTLVSDISVRDTEYTASVSGKTNAKNLVEDELLDLLTPLADTLNAYASRNKIEDLKAKSKVNRSQLKGMRDNDLISKARLIHDLLNSNIIALADFGVTSARLTDLLNKIVEYEEARGVKETSFATKSATRQTLSQLFDKADLVLKTEIDALIENFKFDNRMFYNKYWSARVIKDLGLGHKEAAAPAAT
ncbi:MAG: hypothetical protein NTX65_15345 [Ignavibacteriales bacterium]|nr:hypothetical protein [Ignavibacteriales bacterium]